LRFDPDATKVEAKFDKAVAWYAAEALLAYAAGWPFSLRSIATWMLRTRWIAAWIGSDFEWRGNAMTIADQGQSA